MSRDNLMGFPIVVPPLDEQKAIADFLDRETARIDKLIAKQEQLIATLKERRQALITEVVTRGLDRSAEFAQGGHRYLRPTPSHWRWLRLKDVATVTPSNVDKKEYENGSSVLLCNYVDVYYNDFITADIPFMEATATPTELRKFELQRDWVIFTKDSESAEDIGIAAHVPRDMPGVVCGYHLSVARPKPEVSGLFLKWYFDASTTKAFMSERSNGLTRMALGQRAVSTLPVCLPPFQEQVAIGSFLFTETKEMDNMADKALRAVNLLAERRQALISAAVTGKLEVRA
jgi:type I restriction enzyme S subunit